MQVTEWVEKKIKTVQHMFYDSTKVYTVKSHFKALGLYNIVSGFGWAYKWGGAYIQEVL